MAETPPQSPEDIGGDPESVSLDNSSSTEPPKTPHLPAKTRERSIEIFLQLL